jgi:steroid delta-isomerase-like uncharacterized protein
MSTPREIANRLMAAFNAKDADAFVSNESPEIEFVVPGGITLSGREQVRGYLQIFWDAFPDARVEEPIQVATDEAVVTEAAITGTHTGTLRSPSGDIPATGRRVNLRQVAVVRVKDGLAVSEHLYFDQMEMMAQLGMLPAGAPA